MFPTCVGMNRVSIALSAKQINKDLERERAMGKGSSRRPEAREGAYAEGFEKIEGWKYQDKPVYVKQDDEKEEQSACDK